MLTLVDDGYAAEVIRGRHYLSGKTHSPGSARGQSR